MNNSKAWINVGYDLFAQEGYEGLQVERLARILNLNKSGFYHYFGKTTFYQEHLMRHHHEMVDLLVQEIQSIDVFDPDYYYVLTKHSTCVMATMQLLRNRHVPLFEQTYDEVNVKIDRATLPTWSTYVGAPDNPELAFRYLTMIRDLFYARISYERLNVNYLDTLFSDAKNFLEEVYPAEPSFSESHVALRQH